MVSVKAKCILLHYIKFANKQLMRQKFLKYEFSENNQRYSTNGKKLGQEAYQRSGTRLSQTCPRFSSLIVVTKTVLLRYKMSS